MDKDILLHYRMIRQVNQCRRLIQQEFGVRVHLDSPNLAEELQRFAESSRSDQLKTIWKAMMEELAPSEPQAARAARRIYRGRALPANTPEEPPGERAKSPSVRIYRGRVVSA
ncbi:hypothetical protein QQM79_09580 [Marinobacteraceae bacterium S3BR75-40.1]